MTASTRILCANRGPAKAGPYDAERTAATGRSLSSGADSALTDVARTPSALGRGGRSRPTQRPSNPVQVARRISDVIARYIPG